MVQGPDNIPSFEIVISYVDDEVVFGGIGRRGGFDYSCEALSVIRAGREKAMRVMEEVEDRLDDVECEVFACTIGCPVNLAGFRSVEGHNSHAHS